ncbi:MULTISPECIES: hypothetical protein [Acinetobacter]|jgi:hypothetical protein|uniref:Uncharacterized protein n=2 Tax=Acinetobacter TaxID=469 RepID=A0ABX9U110_9GAMM|nr:MULTISPECIES: hypothetical protein [Acinetobacter]PZM06351.1 hypothetical protein DOL92_02005 [Acinetobacter nosocomialis]RLL35796.1 hypothetical protein D9K79_18305 [Acinetobacter cumulans]
MYFKLICAFISIFFINISVHAEMIMKYENEGFIDKSWFENEKQIIERSASLTSPSGKLYTTRQRFIVIDHNTIEYIPDSSSLDTLKYIQEICGKDGLKPAPEPIEGLGYQRLGMRSAFGMSCVSN